MTIKRKHVYSVKIMEILIARTKEQKMYFNFSSGRDPGQTSVVEWKHQQELTNTDKQHKSNGTETDLEKKGNEKGNLLNPISSIHST